MGQTKTTRSISATGLFLLIMITVGLYSCTRTQKDIIPSADYAPYVTHIREESSRKIRPYV